MGNWRLASAGNRIQGGMSGFLRCAQELSSCCLSNRLPGAVRKDFFPSSLAIKSMLHENCFLNRLPAVAGMLSIDDTLDLFCSPALPWHNKDSALGLLGLVGWVGVFYKENALSCVTCCLEVFL